LWLDYGLANGVSGAHSRAMELIISRIVGLVVAVFVASLLAIALGYVAHYGFGLSRLDIRTSALEGAATAALIFALLVATEWFEKLRKSK
jgi:hypothetical protein